MLLFLITFVILYGTLATSLITKKYDIEVGEIPKSDIKAPREMVDEKATEARQKEVVEKVDKQYSLKNDVEKQNEDTIKTFFTKVSAIRDGSQVEADKLAEISKLSQFKMDEKENKILLILNKEQFQDVEVVMLDALKKAYETPIQEEKQQELQRARNVIDNVVSNSENNRATKDMMKNMAYSLIKPNLFYDKEKTEEKIKEATKDLSPIVVKKNQTIVKEGEPVTAHQIEVLKSLGLLNESRFDLYVYIALAILVLFIMYLQYGYIHKYYRTIYEDLSKLILVSILNIIAVILARTVSIISPFLIPLACAPILITLLINYKVSIVLSMLNMILVSGAVNFNPTITLLAILNTMLGATVLRKMQQRNDILYGAIYIAALSSVLTFCIGMVVSNNIMEILTETGFTAVGGALAGVLAVGLLPFFESTFDVVTTVKLLELSNPNHPLLKKILMEAPGTYHHSVMVANIAEVAAEKVGGNPVLTRIGAYYHDVGKIKRPYFFKENQIGKENPHDKITANLSTLIITSHVKDGLELAKEYDLPKVVQNFIATHHGTTLVKYFYLTMKNSSQNPDEVKEEDYSYPGPKPESKEEGILMLADSVEAAVRSISDPTKGKIEEMVNNIIKEKLYSGQLDNCDLTLKDIDVIRKSFLKALTAIYHQRIEYPTENKKKE
ncbi:HD family phosphohydrolase [Clostridium cavendishii]|nr:HDIG domain-containing metalloprotein [Clostridium cavendishii]